MWRRIRDPGIKPRIFILLISDVYFWGIDDNLEQLVLDIFHDGFLVNDKFNYIIGVVYCRKRDAYFSSIYFHFGKYYSVCHVFEGVIGSNDYDASLNFGIFGVV